MLASRRGDAGSPGMLGSGAGAASRQGANMSGSVIGSSKIGSRLSELLSDYIHHEEATILEDIVTFILPVWFYSGLVGDHGTS